MAAAAGWLIGALYYDGWAHQHVPELEEFLTVWHAVFYAGFLAVSALVVGVAVAELSIMLAALLVMALVMAASLGPSLTNTIIAIAIPQAARTDSTGAASPGVQARRSWPTLRNDSAIPGFSTPTG
jgi:hypothetical protein